MTTDIVETTSLRQDEWGRDALAAAAFGAIPILGVLLWGWNPLGLLLLFSLENAVIGVRQIAMMMLVGRAQRSEGLSAFGHAVFFTAHYGAFTAAHAFFSVILVWLMGPNAPMPEADGSYPVDLAQAWSNAFDILGGYLPGVIAIIGWQVFQLVLFARRGEAKTVTLNRLMGEPYVRVAVLHIVMLVGASLVLGHTFSTRFFLILAIYKVAVDVGEIYWRTHRKPPKTIETLPPPKPGLAFDAASSPVGAQAFFWFVGLFLVFGILMLPANVWFGLLWLAFTGGIGTLALLSVRSMRRKLAASLSNGAGLVVEGPVENLESIARNTNRRELAESFTVKTVPFTYSGSAITGGFNKTALEGGPIREGLQVRIHYLPMPQVGNVIARLEVLG